MAYDLLWQDWTRIVTASATAVTQSAARWLDVSRFRDLLVYTSVQASTSSPLLTIQTAPGPDDALFADVGTPQTLTANTQQRSVFPFESTVPALSRFLRWRLTSSGGGAYAATFRIYLGYTLQSGADATYEAAFRDIRTQRHVTLQDTTCVKAAAGASVIQTERAWLDLADCQDLVVYVYCTDATGGGAGTLLHIETAPVPDGALFESMGFVQLRPDRLDRLVLRFADLAVPLARWLRWRVTHASSPFAAQFVIKLATFTRGAGLVSSAAGIASMLPEAAE